MNLVEGYGPLFGGVSPDIYSAVMLCATKPLYFEYDFPVVVPGISGSSTSGLSSDGRHVGRLFASAHLIPFRGIKWDRRVPKFYSVQSVWAYSMICALIKTNSKIRPYFWSLYLETAVFNRKYLRSVLFSVNFWIKNNRTEALIQFFPSLVKFFGSVLNRWRERQKRHKGPATFLATDIKNSEDAKIALEHWLSKIS
jgi:hypothetical protein